MNLEISNRLQKVISHFKLTSAKFADAIAVPRSSVSHILNNRNKPSLDFVLKVIKVYPEVDLYWLLEGKGDFPSPDQRINQSIHTKIETTSNKSSNTTKELEKRASNSQKEINKVMIFYKDGTFESYNPNK